MLLSCVHYRDWGKTQSQLASWPTATWQLSSHRLMIGWLCQLSTCPEVDFGWLPCSLATLYGFIRVAYATKLLQNTTCFAVCCMFSKPSNQFY